MLKFYRDVRPRLVLVRQIYIDVVQKIFLYIGIKHQAATIHEPERELNSTTTGPQKRITAYALHLAASAVAIK